MIMGVNCHVENGYFSDELLFTKTRLHIVEPERYDAETISIPMSYEIPEGTELIKLSQKREYTPNHEKSFEWEFSCFDWGKTEFESNIHVRADKEQTISRAKESYQKALTDLLDKGYVPY